MARLYCVKNIGKYVTRYCLMITCLAASVIRQNTVFISFRVLVTTSKDPEKNVPSPLPWRQSWHHCIADVIRASLSHSNPRLAEFCRHFEQLCGKKIVLLWTNGWSSSLINVSKYVSTRYSCSTASVIRQIGLLSSFRSEPKSQHLQFSYARPHLQPLQRVPQGPIS